VNVLDARTSRTVQVNLLPLSFLVEDTVSKPFPAGVKGFANCIRIASYTHCVDVHLEQVGYLIHESGEARSERQEFSIYSTFMCVG